MQVIYRTRICPSTLGVAVEYSVISATQELPVRTGSESNLVTDEDAYESAVRAQNAGDLRDALQKWRDYRTRVPNDPRGYAGLGSAFRNLNHLDEAEAVLEEGIKKFPADEKITMLHAWVAHSRGVLPEADRRWTAFRKSFPNCMDGYFGGGAILRAMNRYDEADVLYRGAFARFPISFGLLGDFAAVAQSRGDSAEATRRWTTLHTLFPNRLDAFLRQSRGLRDAGLPSEAESVMTEALKRFPDSEAGKIEFAHIAQSCGRWPDALARWEVVITDCPGVVDGYMGAAQALNELGRFADAQNVLQPAVRKFPDSMAAASLSAWTEHYRGNYSEACVRWKAFRERFPSQATGYIGAVASLLALRQTEEAEELIGMAKDRFPDNVNVAIEFARLPQYAQQWDDAASRWKSVLERFPESPVAHAGYGLVLSRSGNNEAAEKIVALALSRSPNSYDLHAAFAEIAGHRADGLAVLARWQAAVDRFPARVAAWVALGESMRKAGLMSESTALFNKALEKFPANLSVEHNLALNATAQRDWATALVWWAKLKKKCPRNPKIRDDISHAVLEAQLDISTLSKDESGKGERFEIPASLLTNEDIKEDIGSLRSLFMRFESIGDTCEFGIVQRRFGAEPISLLRWSSTPVAHLVTALDSHFAGVGDAEHTVISAMHGEYVTQDRRYHMFSHTFTPEASETLEKFTVRHLRRMRFLRDKLIEDLANGEKAFVYKSNAGLSDKDAMDIFKAIRRYGSGAVLLCVRLQDDLHPSGTLLSIEEGLFVGYIDRFSTVDINVDAWVTLCKETDARRHRSSIGVDRSTG